jgi:hypothetical protein
MKKYLCFVVLSFFLCLEKVIAQEPKVIKIKKESDLVKAVFDNVDLRLMAIDRFGNPRDNKIVSYKLFIKSAKETKEFSGFNNSLTGEMVNTLNKLKKTAKLFFTDIIVNEDNDHLLKLPDVIDVWFPNCKNCINRMSN